MRTSALGCAALPEASGGVFRAKEKRATGAFQRRNGQNPGQKMEGRDE